MDGEEVRVCALIGRRTSASAGRQEITRRIARQTECQRRCLRCYRRGRDDARRIANGRRNLYFPGENSND